MPTRRCDGFGASGAGFNDPRRDVQIDSSFIDETDTGMEPDFQGRRRATLAAREALQELCKVANVPLADDPEAILATGKVPERTVQAMFDLVRKRGIDQTMVANIERDFVHVLLKGSPQVDWGCNYI